ncbi:hypothetical protein C5C37_10545 [Rathayibacter sp. AY1F9]|nr:hypothetical protein C5C37_10545 [Rathayibacter sp. AY1F9]
MGARPAALLPLGDAARLHGRRAPAPPEGRRRLLGPRRLAPRPLARHHGDRRRPPLLPRRDRQGSARQALRHRLRRQRLHRPRPRPRARDRRLGAERARDRAQQHPLPREPGAAPPRHARRHRPPRGRPARALRDQDHDEAVAEHPAPLPAAGLLAAVRPRRRAHARRLGAAPRLRADRGRAELPLGRPRRGRDPHPRAAGGDADGRAARADTRPVTVLLLHGLGGDRSQPLGLLRSALPAGSEVIAPDVRAHGASELLGAPGDFALEALADEVTEEIVRSGAAHKPLTVLGISMGAAIALRLAVRRVLPIDRAVFVRPAFTAEPLPENLTVFPVIAQLLHDHGAKRGERMFRASGLFARAAEVSPASAEALTLQFRSPRAAERAVRLAQIPRNAAYRDSGELGEVIARTLVIAAERDPVHPVEVAEAWARALPDADCERVPSRDEGFAAQQDRIRGHVRGWLARR